jgi:hypothetical protein
MLEIVKGWPLNLTIGGYKCELPGRGDHELKQYNGSKVLNIERLSEVNRRGAR